MDDITRDPTTIRAEDVNPRYNWGRALPALGIMGVDFEERVDYRRLHRYRLGRVKQALEKSELGVAARLRRQQYPVLHLDQDRRVGARQAVPLGADHAHQQRSDPVGFRLGGGAPQALHALAQAGELQGRPDRPARHGQSRLRPDGAPRQGDCVAAQGSRIEKLPVGVDIIKPPMMFELQKAGLKVADGQQTMLEAREIKSADEIALLNRSAAMVDGAYHLIHEQLKPGVRENDIVAEVNKFLYHHGSDDVEAINAISGERCNPHPHNFTDRMLRPGDQAFFDILQSFMGYRTCYYRTFNVGRATPVQHDAYKKAREWLDLAIDLIKPGVSTDRVCSVWPKAQDFGFPDEMSAFGLQFGHGIGLAPCTSARSSPASYRSITRPRSRKAWCSRWKPIARPRTASPPRASRRRWWSPTKAAA